MHKHTCGNGHLAASNSGRVPVAAGNVFDAQPLVLEERGAALHPRSTEELHWSTIFQKCGLGLVHVARLRVVNSDGVLLFRLLIAAPQTTRRKLRASFHAHALFGTRQASLHMRSNFGPHLDVKLLLELQPFFIVKQASDTPADPPLIMRRGTN